MNDGRLLIIGFTGTVAVILLGIIYQPVPECPQPVYDVDRVVKMHEEVRTCGAEREECQDSLKVCNGLLNVCLGE